MDSEKRAVSEIISSKHFRELTKQVIIRLAKNNNASEMIRKQGNDYFNNKIHNAQEHEDAWKLYSMSAAVAENGSESLALSYSNRSIILLHMCKFEQSIVDINRALHITKNDCLRVKLLLRKVKCMHALNDDETHSVLKEVESSVKKFTIPALKDKFEKDIKEIEFMLKMPHFHVESKNKKHDMLNALKKKHSVNDFSSVEIQSNDKYGRYLTATKDIKPGEVIYIEKPYIRCLNIKKLHAYCSHCFKTTWTNIPCDNCSWTMFCSEECKEDAWQKYHDIECSVYACAKDDDGIDTSKQMAIRAMILALKEYGNIKKLEAQLLKWDECADNKEAFLENGKVKGNGFKSMYMMSGHVTPKLFKKHKKDTGRVLRSLGKNTSFFGNNFDYSNVESYKNNENVLFLGALFLRLSKICDINSFQMWNDSYKCRNNLELNFMCWMNECCTRGVYIAPITSLLNHSCSPNANRCYSDNHKVILYAVQPIKKGAQIFHSYQGIYYKCPTNLRREFLSHMYNFSCECAACQGNWQEYNDLHVLSNEISKNPAAMLEFKSEFGDVIDLVISDRCNYDENILDKLKSGIERSLATLNQPSIFTVELIKCLSITFEKFYGIWLHVPDECNPMKL